MQQRSQFLLPYCYLAFFLFAVKTSRMTIKSTVIVFIVGFLCYSFKYDEGSGAIFLCSVFEGGRELLDPFY